MSAIEIRVCKSWDDCLQCEELQHSVWGMPGYRDVVPANLLITAAKNGGLLIGAFDGPRMIGFVFGFLGTEGQGAARHIKHTSHMLAILPDVRVRGLGTALKWKQREEALQMDLDLMTWTFDPLQAINAQLNLVRLGAIARRYVRDAYGETTDALNIGIPSDRFEVEWYLSSARVIAHAAGQASLPLPPAHSVFQVEWNAAGLPFIAAEAPIQAEALLIDIPPDIQALKAQALPIAAEWRARTRAIFERAFESGYVATDVLRAPRPDGRPRVAYLLRQAFPVP